MTTQYKFVPVQDKKSNEVELKHKVADVKCNLYTLNMYNTTSSCLINGKKPEHFFSTDVPKILDIVESELDFKCTSISEVNESMKQQILIYLEHKSEHMSPNIINKPRVTAPQEDKNAHNTSNVQIIDQLGVTAPQEDENTHNTSNVQSIDQLGVTVLQKDENAHNTSNV